MALELYLFYEMFSMIMPSYAVIIISTCFVQFLHLVLNDNRGAIQLTLKILGTKLGTKLGRILGQIQY